MQTLTYKGFFSWDKDDHKLSMSLMTAITDDNTIARVLFPKVGPNPSTRAGGGKPKMDHYWELCKILFTEHPEHGAAFAPALAGDKLERKAWTMKIKNRLHRCVCDLGCPTPSPIVRSSEITDLRSHLTAWLCS